MDKNLPYFVGGNLATLDTSHVNTYMLYVCLFVCRWQHFWFWQRLQPSLQLHRWLFLASEPRKLTTIARSFSPDTTSTARVSSVTRSLQSLTYEYTQQIATVPVAVARIAAAPCDWRWVRASIANKHLLNAMRISFHYIEYIAAGKPGHTHICHQKCPFACGGRIWASAGWSGPHIIYGSLVQSECTLQTTGLPLTYS